MAKKANMLPEKILLDADALVALVNKNDSGFLWAKKTSQKITAKNYFVYLSNFAYGEALTVISMQLGLKKAMEVAEAIENSNFIIIDIEKSQREKALKKFAKQTTKNTRFTDCINMVLMEELSIKQIFSRDKHYKKSGFIRLGLDD